MNTKHRGKITGEIITRSIPLPAGGVRLETFIPWTLIKRGCRKEIITPIDAPQAFREEAEKERAAKRAAQDTPLLRALGLAHHWKRLLEDKRCASLTEIAAAEGMDLAQASRIARLAFLAPDLIERIERGELRIGLSQFPSGKLPACWALQREILTKRQA